MTAWPKYGDAEVVLRSAVKLFKDPEIHLSPSRNSL